MSRSGFQFDRWPARFICCFLLDICCWSMPLSRTSMAWAVIFQMAADISGTVHLHHHGWRSFSFAQWIAGANWRYFWMRMMRMFPFSCSSFIPFHRFSYIFPSISIYFHWVLIPIYVPNRAKSPLIHWIWQRMRCASPLKLASMQLEVFRNLRKWQPIFWGGQGMMNEFFDVFLCFFRQLCLFLLVNMWYFFGFAFGRICVNVLRFWMVQLKCRMAPISLLTPRWNSTCEFFLWGFLEALYLKLLDEYGYFWVLLHGNLGMQSISHNFTFSCWRFIQIAIWN